MTMDRKIERYLAQVAEFDRLGRLTVGLFEKDHPTAGDRALMEAYDTELIRLDNMRNALEANDPAALEWADAFLSTQIEAQP